MYIMHPQLLLNEITENNSRHYYQVEMVKMSIVRQILALTMTFFGIILYS